MRDIRTREHGKYQIERFGAVILSTVVDAWNEATMAAYAADFRAVAAPLVGTAGWGLIVDARNWRLAVPEVGPKLAELARWKDDNGLVAAAYINDDYELKAAFAADNIFRHYETARIELVSSPSDAIAWIEQHDIEVPPELQHRLDGE